MDANRTRDEWIALRCQSGDPAGFEDLVSSIERPLLYYATKLTGNEETALDVLQEVWIKAFHGIRKLKDPAAVRPWLYSIAHGIVVDRIRRNRSRERAEEAISESFQETSEPSFTCDNSDAIHQALSELEPEHREVLVLHFLEEFSLLEISRVIGRPEGTVKSRLHYARKAMKTILLRGGYGKSR